jgi:hypothetical protein
VNGLDESRELIEALTRVAAELEYTTTTAVNVDTHGTMEGDNHDLKGNPEVRP